MPFFLGVEHMWENSWLHQFQFHDATAEEECMSSVLCVKSPHGSTWIWSFHQLLFFCFYCTLLHFDFIHTSTFPLQSSIKTFVKIPAFYSQIGNAPKNNWVETPMLCAWIDCSLSFAIPWYLITITGENCAFWCDTECELWAAGKMTCVASLFNCVCHLLLLCWCCFSICPHLGWPHFGLQLIILSSMLNRTFCSVKVWKTNIKYNLHILCLCVWMSLQNIKCLYHFTAPIMYNCTWFIISYIMENTVNELELSFRCVFKFVFN